MKKNELKNFRTGTGASDDFRSAEDLSARENKTLYRSKSSPSQDILTNSRKHKHTHLFQPLCASQRRSSCSSKVASNKHNITTATTSGKKMDTCVPSPNLMNTPFAASPQSYSIYDQDRQSMFCGGSKVSNNVDISGLTLSTEDSGLLDDNFENTSLQSILTPELISSITSSSSSFPMTYPWESKYVLEGSSGPSTSSDPSFILPMMDTDSFISNFLNIDSNDSKFSLPTFDFESMTSNPPSSCHTPTPLSESKQDFMETTADRLSYASSNKEVLCRDSIGQDFVQKKFTTMKSNFPPRRSEPPVGVVTPVIIPEENNKNFPCHPANFKAGVMDSKGNDYKAAASTMPCTSSLMDMAELPPQTVPSFGISNQIGYSPVKMEPVSPECHRRKETLKRCSTVDKWVESEHFMKDVPSGSKSKRRRCDSGSSGHTLSSEDGDEDDNDFVYNNDDDSDDDADLDADLAHMKPGSCESLFGVGKKQKQFFWQYNVQAKGPKGTRLKLAVESPTDPHVLNGFEDPVFDEGNTIVAGIRHGGKARKGDGNEVSPNPHKLFKIGHQLLRLNKKINACQLGSDVPLAKRNESRKEKNKLASRACRLKKKAQHEANKIKLHGLEMEHGQINNVLRLLWPELRERAKSLMNKKAVDEKDHPENSFTNKLTGYISTNLKSMVAGNTTDYVNNIIMAVERGDLSGGLKIKSKKT